MIKRLIDAFRCREGYAGMAIYRENELLFYEGLEPGFADKVRLLFEDNRTAFYTNSIIAIIRGFTVTTFRADDLLIICRLEGRFTPLPRPAAEEPEYLAGQQAAHLMTREEARREAEIMLKKLMSID